VTLPARLGIAAFVGVIAGIFTFIPASILPARAVAKDFIQAVKESRVPDAYALAEPEMRFDGEVGKTFDRMRQAKDLRYGGVVQLGFSGNFDWYSCFDAEMEGDARAWLVLTRKGAVWRVAHLQSSEPEQCKGSD
jgi:hypothetical protein